MGSCLCAKSDVDEKVILGNPEEFKSEGNAFFKEGKYEDAIAKYSKAIKVNSSVSVYFSNRALCYYKLKNYINSFEDGHAAYKLDKANFKGILLCIKSKASQSLNFSSSSLNQLNESIAFFQYLETLPFSVLTNSLVEYFKGLKTKILELKPYVEKNHRKSIMENYYKPILPKELYEKVNKFMVKSDKPMESLMCPLTLEFFDSPVVISSGNTYENKMVENLIQINKFQDPLNRKSFSQTAIYFNKSVKSAIQWYTHNYPEITSMSDNKDFEF